MPEGPQVRYRPPRAVVAAVVLSYLAAGLLFAAGVWLVFTLSTVVRDFGLPWGAMLLIASCPLMLSFAFLRATDRFRAGRGRRGLLALSSVAGVLLLLAYVNTAHLLALLALLVLVGNLILLMVPTTTVWNSRPHSPLWRVRANKGDRRR